MPKTSSEKYGELRLPNHEAEQHAAAYKALAHGPCPDPGPCPACGHDHALKDCFVAGRADADIAPSDKPMTATEVLERRSVQADPQALLGTHIVTLMDIAMGGFRTVEGDFRTLPRGITPGDTFVYAPKPSKTATITAWCDQCGSAHTLGEHTLPKGAYAAGQSLPESALARKELPLATGLIDYFPAALVAVAGLSRIGNEQHNPGKPLAWDRSKSGDESDALLRHFLDRGTIDTDGVRHSVKVAWRALALLQKELEAAGAPMARGAR